MNALIEKLGSNFLVTAFIPSLAYVTLGMIIFAPIIPPDVLSLVTNTLQPLDQTGIILLLLTVIIGSD
jgi:hypothetical protein